MKFYISRIKASTDLLVGAKEVFDVFYPILLFVIKNGILKK